MKPYDLSRLSDAALLRDLSALVARDRATTADLLAHLAEVDERKLYLPAAYPSLFAWCVGELHFSEGVAYKRIRAARAARRFPVLYGAVADGRLHLTAVVLLAPHLTRGNMDELVAAATHRGKEEIEQLLAVRFPQPDLPTEVLALGSPSAPVDAVLELSAPARIGTQGLTDPSSDERTKSGSGELDPDPVGTPARVAPLSAERFALQVTIGRETQEKLRYAQELLGHQLPAGEVAEVLDRALDLLIAHLEQRKFGATDRPRRSVGSACPRGRHIPAGVKREVWQRDGGQCTFVSAAGHRCEARTRLEFDHVEEFARGGHSTVAGLRLRCRAHNKYGAERTFGAGFMHEKRREAALARARKSAEAERARQAAAAARAQKAAEAERARQAAAAARAREEEVTPYLRQLGFRPDEARRAVQACADLSDARLEDRVRAALRWLGCGRGRPGSAGYSQPSSTARA